MRADLAVMAALIASATSLPGLAYADDNQTAAWTMGPGDESATVYRNDSYASTRIRLTVCFDRYSAPGPDSKAPTLLVGQVPPTRQRLPVTLGGCSSVSYLMAPDTKVTLALSPAEPGATAAGSYQIATP